MTIFNGYVVTQTMNSGGSVDTETGWLIAAGIFILLCIWIKIGGTL